MIGQIELVAGENRAYAPVVEQRREADLALMNPSAYLINTSRGPIVDESALIGALRAGRIAGAGLDVYDVEPLPVDHPLRSLPNTLLLPHIGYVTSDNYRSFYRDAVEDILAFTAGSPVRVLTRTIRGFV